MRGIALAESRKGEALYELLTRQIRSGKRDGAITAELITHPYYRALSLAALAVEQAKQGNVMKAIAMFEDALEKVKEVQDKEEQSGNLCNAARALIARARAEAGQEREALAWAAEQKEPLLHSQALLCIAEGMAAHQATKPARK